MSNCWFCGCRTASSKVVLENPILESNTKIDKRRLAAVSLPPGDPKLGGSCEARTPACDGCYAQLGAIIYSSADERRAQNMELFKGNPDDWVNELVADIEEEESPLVRVHGVGDFFSEEYVRAWIKVTKRLPRVQFFGTTRTWQFAFRPSGTLAPDSAMGREQAQSTIAFLDALDELRFQPNMTLGASTEGDVYLSSKEALRELDPLGRRIAGTGKRVGLTPTRYNHRDFRFSRGPYAGKTIVEYLREKRFNIWNMLSEIGDPAYRARHGLRVASGGWFGKIAEAQFRFGVENGLMVGSTGCPEQMRIVKDCRRCVTAASPNGPHCVQKADGLGTFDINFAYHPGKSRGEQNEEAAVRVSWGLPASEEAASKYLKSHGFGGKDGPERYAQEVLRRRAEEKGAS